MIEPLLKLKVRVRGRDSRTWEELNNDTPSDVECVAEALADLEHRIAELVECGGYDPKKIGPMSLPAYALDSLMSSIKLLNNSLIVASRLDWKLQLERNPEEKTDCALFGPAILPVEGCTCENCEEVRQYGPVNSDGWCAHRREMWKAVKS